MDGMDEVYYDEMLQMEQPTPLLALERDYILPIVAGPWVADALSHRLSLITTMQIRVQGFDSFCGLYCDDPDFREIWSKCDNGPFQQLSKLDGYLFKGARLCIHLFSLREAIVLEGHAGGLTGHLGRGKTLALREQFYWPKMERDVNRLLERCITCHIAKTHSSNAGLYTHLSVPVALWEDMAHFVPCSKSFDASQVARLYFAEIVKLHVVPKTLTFDRDFKFVSHFWRTLWTRLGSKLQFSSSHHPQTDGSVNCTTSKSPFEVVYGRNPITPLDLVPVPEVRWFSEEGADQSEQIKELHRSVREQIIRHNEQYKEHADKRRKQILYREGDLVWIHLRKERFSAGHFGKLKPRGDGPFHFLKKINDNAYKIELPGHYNVSATFNVADLSPYKGDSDDEPDSGSNLFQEGEDDADAQLDKDEFREDGSMAAFWVLNNQFQQFIDSQFSSDYDSKALDTDLVVMESSGTKSKMQDESSRSGNDTYADAADIKPIYDEELMIEVQLTAECNIFVTGQQHTELPEFNNEGGVDYYTKKCQVKSLMLDPSLDNKTTEFLNQSLESENICLKKTVAQFQKDFSRIEAHCIALELKYKYQPLNSGQHGQILKLRATWSNFE
ncbi:RNA-directed DNA polymerase [Tanacetum coccineum]